MGTIDRQLPAGVVFMGVVVMILMAAGLICCIAKDITEMRIYWIAADREQRKKPRNREPEKRCKEEKADLRRRKRHGVNLQETDLRQGIRHDHHTGSTQNPVQGEGHPNAVPCGTEG